ncbi:MAG: GTPase Era [Chloroflexi bacterium]|nr:GTPase Era [Chloroflexota bacterium]|tara:strand:+ start:1294 stop:2181 length:888 start_codon:yes stop_codon:yes gene_type:complete
MMYKSGVVALVGSPNVGKSTLVNSLLGQKIAIVSSKPQTTRDAQRGILTTENAQVIFVDTPGVLRPNYVLDRTMLAIARSAVQDADVVLWIVDVAKKPSNEERRIAKLIEQTNSSAAVYLAMNKSDLLKPENVINHTNIYRSLCDKAIWMLVSAKRGDNVERVKKDIIDLMPEGPKYYENDEITDKTIRELSGELLRESALYYLRHEIPHGIAVLVEEFIEKEDGKIEIIATLVVENNRHKGVVIGKNGSMIKAIGIRARREIEKMIEQPVNLQTFVKVKADWRNDNYQLKHMGY